MIALRNGSEYRYDYTSPGFRTAFEFLKRNDLADLPLGWLELDHGVRASVQRYTSFLWDENKFEAHEDYFDIQYIVKGSEVCGVCSRDGLSVAVPYDKDSDIVFFAEPEHCSKVYLAEGDFIILSPEDAHKPRCMADRQIEVGKIVLKVPVR